MAKHLMIDLETLAVSHRALVLTLGAVQFNPYTDEIFDQLYIRLNLDDQQNRDVDVNTIDWWAKQDNSVIEEAFSKFDRVPLYNAIEQFHKFAWGCSCFWSHGATFDLMVIEDIYKQIDFNGLPWQYWQLRDTRTLFDLGHDPEMPKHNKHDALQDAIRQAKGVQNVYRKLGIKHA